MHQKHSVARSGSKIARMHLGRIFMKGFSADLTFELELKIFELAPKISTARAQYFVQVACTGKLSSSLAACFLGQKEEHVL